MRSLIHLILFSLLVPSLTDAGTSASLGQHSLDHDAPSSEATSNSSSEDRDDVKASRAGIGAALLQAIEEDVVAAIEAALHGRYLHLWRMALGRLQIGEDSELTELPLTVSYKRMRSMARFVWRQLMWAQRSTWRLLLWCTFQQESSKEDQHQPGEGPSAEPGSADLSIDMSLDLPLRDYHSEVSSLEVHLSEIGICPEERSCSGLEDPTAETGVKGLEDPTAETGVKGGTSERREEAYCLKTPDRTEEEGMPADEVPGVASDGVQDSQQDDEREGEDKDSLSVDPWAAFRINLPSLERWGISSPAGLILFKTEILWRESSSHAATILLMGGPLVLGGALWAIGHGLEWLALLALRPGGRQRRQLREWCFDEWNTWLSRWQLMQRVGRSVARSINRSISLAFTLPRSISRRQHDIIDLHYYPVD